MYLDANEYNCRSHPYFVLSTYKKTEKFIRLLSRNSRFKWLKTLYNTTLKDLHRIKFFESLLSIITYHYHYI